MRTGINTIRPKKDSPGNRAFFLPLLQRGEEGLKHFQPPSNFLETGLTPHAPPKIFSKVFIFKKKTHIFVVYN